MKFKNFKPVKVFAAALSFILLLGIAEPAAGTTFDPLSPEGSAAPAETTAETTREADAPVETTMEAVGSAAITGYLSTGLEEMAEQGYVLPSNGDVKFASSVKNLYDGTFVDKLKEVSTYQGKQIKIVSLPSHQMLLETEGETLTNSPFDFQMLPRAIQMVVPNTNETNL